MVTQTHLNHTIMCGNHHISSFLPHIQSAVASSPQMNRQQREAVFFWSTSLRSSRGGKGAPPFTFTSPTTKTPPPQLFKAITACKMSSFHPLPVFLVMSGAPPLPVPVRLCLSPGESSCGGLFPSRVSWCNILVRAQPSNRREFWVIRSHKVSAPSVRRGPRSLNSTDKIHPTQNEVVSE